MYNTGFETGVWFSIYIGDEEFLTYITSDALSIHFAAPEKVASTLVATYKHNQIVINDIARRKFLNGAPRPVKLSVGDF